jgi:hypothetical protein
MCQLMEAGCLGGGGDLEWSTVYVSMLECEINWFPFFTVQSDSEYKCTSHSLTGQRHKIFYSGFIRESSFSRPLSILSVLCQI